MKESWSLPASIKTSTGYSIIPKGPGPWISMKNTWKIQQNASMTQTLIRLLLVASISKSWAITDLFHASLLSRTNQPKIPKIATSENGKKLTICLEFPPKKTTKIENEFHSANSKDGRFSIFLGGETNKPSHGKTPTSNKLLGSFQLPLGDLRFVEGFHESHWRPSWNPETGCCNVAETCVLVEYEGNDALVSKNCQKKNKQ